MTGSPQYSIFITEAVQISLSLLFFIVFVFMAGITWYAAAARQKKLYNAVKPFVILPLIAWFITRGRTDTPYLLFLIGLSLSFFGDIAMVFTNRTVFFTGMFLFALAHLSYAIGYSLWPTTLISFGNFLLVPALVILFGTLFYRPAANKNPAMKTYFQVAIFYAVFILTMLAMAVASYARIGWSPIPATMAFIGALLFVVSDTMIAFERFGYTQKNLRFWFISSYHISQFLIASSVLYIANGGFYF
ncbi:MAG TPA: lysoplasmalogenase [Anaerolineaceae bacterium]|nr:lysoplasmalogenase [Anaerolineaceae bacterium]